MKKLDYDVFAKQFNSSAYQLLEKVGEGGFGHVYRAKQITTGQIVAIKFLSLSPEFDDAKKARYIERFERETLLGSRLQHPNIVRLLDKGSCEDLLYAVFEYVDGKTLKQTLAESGPLAPVEAANVMRQVLDALAHAHQQGVIHRDIKPANIMLITSGAKTHAKVLDFGIGTLVNEARLQDYKSITLTQETLGTPSYSAPEQLRGEPPTLKTDLYVWGLVFIECLTGQPAISGGSLAAVFHKQLSQSNVPLPAAIVGHPISALLRRVLQKKSHERSVDAQTLYNELTQINFSNLVGDMGTAIEAKARQALPLLSADFDETVINNKAAYRTALTERKQITVLSINLCVHAVADAMIDLEVVDTLHRDQKNQCLDIAIRYGAHHVGTLGDTLLFYFGYPTASDNDSRLSARSALDIISSLHKRNALLKSSQGIELDARIGMHTGLMTCYADATPQGNTANIAMQLARLAGKGKILCSDLSQKILQTYIEFEPAQSSVLGVNKTTSALFNLTAERHVEAFGFLRGTQNNPAFIGREHELKQLTALLNNRTSEDESKNKLAHVYGEAGIGKSRLLFELRNSAQLMLHYVAQCLPEHQNNALYPILNIIKYKYSLDALAPEIGLQKLRDEIVKLAQVEELDAIPVLCSWLGLPLPEDMPTLALSPDKQKQVLFETLITLLVCQDRLTVPQANLFIFEDMHWADPTSIEFIACLSSDKRFTASKHLFISTSRQPLPVSLHESGFELLKLDKLSNESTRTFVRILFDKENVSANLLDIVVNRTDGIPLFIEELVNMLKQKGLVQKLNGLFDFTSADKLSEVPSSLRDSLQQKLDTLVHAKESAQLAATIGREFDYDLLVAASNHSEPQVQNDLNELIDAGLIYQLRKVSGDSYIFKHALVKDVTYESMMNDRKKTLHNKIADILCNTFAGFSEKNPEILFHHYKEAVKYTSAIYFGLNAGKKALEKFNNEEAINYSEKVQELLSILPVNEHNAERIKINNIYIQALMAKEGWASERVKKQINHSQKLLEETGYDASAIPTLWALCTYYYVAGDSKEMQFVIDELFLIAKDSNDEGLFSATNLFQGHVFHLLGNYKKANLHLNISIENYDNKKHTNHGLIYGLDTLAWAKATLALNQFMMGETDLTIDLSDQAVKWCESISHLPTLGLVLLYRAKLFQYMGNKTEAEKVTDELLRLTKQYGLPAYEAYALLIKLWASEQKSISVQIEVCKQLKQLGCNLLISYYDSLVADAYYELNEHDLAIEKLTECLDCCEQMNEREYEPELYRRRGMYYLVKDKKRAHEDLKTAVKKAKEQNMHFTEASALTTIINEFG